jgi:hypothetical protein
VVLGAGDAARSSNTFGWGDLRRPKLGNRVSVVTRWGGVFVLIGAGDVVRFAPGSVENCNTWAGAAWSL